MIIRPGKRFSRRRRGFSLLEVMIAAGIFFMASFAILALVSQSLRGARALQRPPVDAGMAASIILATNRFELGTRTRDFEDDALRDYSWTEEVYEVGTNGLLGIDIVMEKRGLKQPFDKLSVIIFDPNYRATPGGQPRLR
jgi:Flp pilus assembly protein TadG